MNTNSRRILNNPDSHIGRQVSTYFCWLALRSPLPSTRRGGAMGRRGLGRWVGIGVMFAVLGGCKELPAAPPTTVTVTGDASDGAREKLYDYCDRATGRDPMCWTDGFGNNLRAAEKFLAGPDESGGQQQTEVAGAQGLGAGAPVGTSLDMLLATMVGLDFVTKDEQSGGSCRTAFDDTAKLGVVTVMTDGPLGPTEIVQAYVIDNPVFRIGRSLSDEKAGLGTAGTGVHSTLADLQASYPHLEVVRGSSGTKAFTSPEPAREQLATFSTERMMVFELGADDRVVSWRIGVPRYAKNFCD